MTHPPKVPSEPQSGCPIFATVSSSLRWAWRQSPPRNTTLLVLTALTLYLSLTPTHPTHPVLAAEASTQHLATPDTACASCHQSIYTRYEKTPMAQGSGIATEALDRGFFHHAPSNIDYRIFLRDQSAWMSFTRTGAQPLSGERRLQLFIGSGRRGRTYLYQQDGLWFELPINFYTRREALDMAPAFDAAATMPAVLPTDPNCLHCHATQIATSLPEARNRFASTPFAQGGIGCAACHGDPTQHLAQHGKGPILNPAKLSVPKRDSACLQCHLEGDAVVYKPNRSLARFLPGEDLSDTATYFVRASRQSGGGRATSQYEALLRSACKRASGDRLTCTTCHDPHSSPSEAERVQYFRGRCLSCHTTPAIATTHHPEQRDCATCHMPTRSTTDISHEQVTDHDIEAHPTPPQPRTFTKGEDLIPVGAAKATDRDLGLAYAQLATRGDQIAAQKALALLTKAAYLNAPDLEMQVQLGFLHQVAAQPVEARAAYLAALKLDPHEPTALANLAVLDASSNQLPEAVHLLQRLVDDNPSQTSAGLNLAFILCSLGHPAQARAVAERLQPFNPDDPQLRLFLTKGDYAGQHCALPTAAP